MARYANDTVTHIWASGKQESGQSHNGQLYFTGPALYSYGQHYCAGYIAEAGRVVLINSTSRSVTTSRHVSLATRATSHMSRHYVPELEDITQWLAPGQPDPALAASAIERHCNRHAHSMTESAIAYLVRSDSKARRIIRDAKREAARAVAEQEKRNKARLLATARAIANYSKADIAHAVNECRSNWNPVHRLKIVGTDTRRAHKAARQAGRTAQAAKVWQFIKALDSARHILERDKERVESRCYIRHIIARLREYLARHETANLWQCRVGADYARDIAGCHWVWPTLADKLNAIARTADTRRDELQAIANAERFERERKAREAWLTGQGGYWRGSDETGGALLRIMGDNLETSQGANVPLSHAIRIFEIARKCRETGKVLEPKARVGLFTVNRIDETGGFNAGCHRINWPEIERIARQLELYP